MCHARLETMVDNSWSEGEPSGELDVPSPAEYQGGGYPIAN